MKNTMTKRLLSFLLALTLIIGLIPVFEAEVSAATVYPQTWDELVAALEADGDGEVCVTGAISVTEHSYTDVGGDKRYDPFDTVQIRGNKTLRLTGTGSIYYKDLSGNIRMTLGVDRWMNNGGTSTMFNIPAGAKLTVEGPVGSKIHFDGNTVGIHDYYNDYSIRNIFNVAGTLVVNGCTLEVGCEDKQYVTAAEDSQVPFLFTGNFYQQIIGHSIVVASGGSCTINGGVINGRGRVIYNDQDSFSVGGHMAAIKTVSGSALNINGGTFYGVGGAHVLDVNGTCHIRAGRFEVVNGRDRTRLPDDDNNCIVGSGTSQSGQLNIPDSSWQNRLEYMYVVENGTIYNTVSEKEGQSLLDGRGPVEFVPYPNQQYAESITYGTLYYENGTVANMHEEWLSWNPFFGNVVLRFQYSNYYVGNVKNGQVKRIWKIWKGTDVSVDPAYTVTTINNEYLDLSAIAKTYDIGWHEADIWYIRCFIEETGPSGTVKRMGKYFLLEIGGLPMTQDELPDSLNMYPAYTNGGDSVQLTVYPTRDQMMDATSFLNLSSLYYKFSYVNADGTSVVKTSSTGVVTLTDLRYGTTSVRYDIVMRDNTGASKTFYSQRTLLRIPQISVTNGTLSSDGSQYIVPNGKADMSISGSGFTSSDIYGWYRLKEDGTYAKLASSGSISIMKGYPTGTYQVGVKDPTGAVVFSKPVVIASSDTYYALNITSDKTVITYDPSLEEQPEIKFTTSHGEGWKAEGYSLSTEILLVSWPGNAESGISRYNWIVTPANLRTFLDTSNGGVAIVPGVYTFQGKVKITAPDGTVTYQYTNAIDITVHRKTDAVEIRDITGNVLGDAIEGPVAGQTMQLMAGAKDGADLPDFTGFRFTLTDVVGENVATITTDGLLTAHKPGRVKVTLTGSYRIEYTNGYFTYGSYTKDLYINIPITDYEVSFEMPKLGDDPSGVFQAPEDAPYTLNVHWEYMDEGDTFSGNQVPQCVLQFTPKPGYVNRLDAYEPEYYKNDWVENFNDLTLTINGETFDAYEVASWVGSSLGMGIISCEYINYGQSYEPYTLQIGYDKFERIIDPSHTYVEETSFQLTEPYVGDPKDISANEYVPLDVTCADAPNLSCAVVFLHKVSADTVYDGDIDNDDTVSMGDDECYEQDQWYRVGIAVSRDNLSYWLSEGMITTVNGMACYNDATEGDTHAIVYYYFTPERQTEVVQSVSILGGEAPKAGYAPTPVESLYIDNDEVSVLYAAWFIDADGDQVLDEGEDVDVFDKFGNFRAYTAYSLFVVLSSDSDYVVLTDDTLVYFYDAADDAGYYCYGTYNGAVASLPYVNGYDHALEADTTSISLRAEEGYTTPPSYTVTVTSTGEHELDTFNAYFSSDDPYVPFDVTVDGMQATVTPMEDLAVGTYTCTLIIDGGDDYAYIEIPVTFDVIYHEIESIDITVEAPKSGSTPSFDVITNDPSQSIARVDYWYEFTDGFPELNDSDTFGCGRTYYLRVMVYAQSGYAIGDSTVITINGKATSLYSISENGDRGVEVGFTTKHAMEYYEADPGTCVEPGHIAYFSCVYCGANYHDASGRQPVADEEMETGLGDHYYYDGKCYYCGEEEPAPVVDPGLTLSYPTLSFEDEIIYNVYFSVADMTSVEELGLMVLSSRDDAATIEDAVALVPGYVTNGTVYLVKSEGIPAANMGDTLYFKVYAKLTDGTYAYSTAGGYNAKAYANSILKGDNSDAMKALVVSMLNYGAEAQLFFGHNTDKLVNSALTAEQQALVKAYDATMMDPIVKADSTKTTDFVRVNSNFKSLYPSVSFDGAFAINFYCSPAITVDSDMTLYYWDMDTVASVEKLSIDNAIGSMVMEPTNGMYWGQVAGIAAKEMDKTYYVTCVFESGGETITTGIIPYSLGKYCSDKAAAEGDAQQAFAQATAVYGYYAKQYFASLG